MALQPVVDANGSRRCRGVGARQRFDARRIDTGDLCRPRRRPSRHPSLEGAKSQRVACDVVGIMQLFAHDHMHHRQRQRGIASRPDRNPIIGRLRCARTDRVDHDQARTRLARLLNKGPEMQIAGQRIAAPDQDQLCMGKTLHLHGNGRPHSVAVALKAGLRTDGARKTAHPEASPQLGGHSLLL